MTGKTEKNAHLWERDPHDWYVEPVTATQDLLSVEQFNGWTHDPCCGRGNIVTTLLAAGIAATGSDVVQRTAAPWFTGVRPFIERDGDGWRGAPYRPWPAGVLHLVFNPPYYNAKGAEACIRAALMGTYGKVAAFVDARFLFSGRRARGLYHDCPPSRVWLLSRRPSCPPGAVYEAHLAETGDEPGGGQHSFAWLVWDGIVLRKGAGERSEVGWI